MRDKQRTKRKGGSGFVPKSITLPGDVLEFAQTQANQPIHAKNMSSYIRTLIIADKAEKDARKAEEAKQHQEAA